MYLATWIIEQINGKKETSGKLGYPLHENLPQSVFDLNHKSNGANLFQRDVWSIIHVSAKGRKIKQIQKHLNVKPNLNSTASLDSSGYKGGQESATPFNIVKNTLKDSFVTDKSLRSSKIPD